MPDGVLGVVGSYDFFGKSIPGAALIAGAISLLPNSVLVVPNNANPQAGTAIFELNTLVDVVALAIVILIAGVVIGQGVHTLAILIENTAYWFGDRVSGTFNVIIDLYGSLSIDLIGRLNAHVSENRILTPIIEITLIFNSKARKISVVDETIRIVNVTKRNWIQGVYKWAWNRYWSINDTFKSHRILFQEQLTWYLSPYINRRRADDVHVTKQRFVEAARDRYDLEDADFQNTNQIYPLIISELSSSDMVRSQSMQARYSFCRGMWVVLLTTVIAYIIVLGGYIQPFLKFGVIFISYEKLFGEPPLIVEIFSGQSPTMVFTSLIFVLTLASAIFMIGSAQYKRHYLEYLFAEFYIFHNFR